MMYLVKSMLDLYQCTLLRTKPFPSHIVESTKVPNQNTCTKTLRFTTCHLTLQVTKFFRFCLRPLSCYMCLHLAFQSFDFAYCKEYGPYGTFYYGSIDCNDNPIKRTDMCDKVCQIGHICHKDVRNQGAKFEEENTKNIQIIENIENQTVTSL